MATQVLTPLNDLETSFTNLLTSLTTTPTYSAAPSATQSLLAADTSLTSALEALYKHQQNYSRILQLRAEASRLEVQIKSTIRTCVDLRKEIGDIHPSILSHSDWDDENDPEAENKRDVDYHTLLSFASKIGKHNTAAAKEAEEESTRRLIEARKGQDKSTASAAAPQTNGTTHTATAPGATGTGTEAGTSTAAGNVNGEITSQTLNLIPQHEREWLDAEAAMARARSGMAFPAAENLRKGALGRLQWIREQGGEEAVDKEIESLIGGGKEGNIVKEAGEDEDVVVKEEVVETAAAAGRQGVGVGLPSRPQQQQQQQRAAKEPERKKSLALDLDMWKSDDDDD
ncbi:hypothetical protein EPUS_06603 [Endocarpon pusillum Z07020]|uniref:Mediator of RNA polymerase II transcription subunit 4 n=1 Tax=Endocarpon pusillum (strain Z07020 / HMAS-L-300199) TaxID=1263415 RepID=U1HUT6_ENDPU|nr:uncharacterized protein EPUS_06603 [Endocarpon pusillum Z07020]ERF74425.1 hypothetical protein EPUS_06603 [Endocarpon pusillum Z07020]